VSASLDLSAPKLGSGARFKKLSATLAARGASDPDALAAFIGRKRYGSTGMGKLSAGKSLANPDLGIYLAETAKDNQGMTLTCPECGHVASAGAFGVNGAALQSSPADLRTPAPSLGGVRKGVPLTVKGGGAHALANPAREALELAAGALTARRPAVSGPGDVGVKRGGVLYHRRGGNEIAQLKHNDDVTWTAVVAGKPLAPHQQQRAALMEAVGTYNAAVNAGARAQSASLQPAPQQTELMAEYGIPAMRSAAFATPTTSSGGGPRVTSAGSSGKAKFDPDGDGDDDSTVAGDTDKDAVGGLSPKALAIYKKLIAKGFPAARALAFAKNSEKFGKPAAS